MSDEAITTKRYVTKQQILAARLPREDVHCPEWGSEGAEWVCVQGLTAAGKSSYQASMVRIDTETGKIAEVVLDGLDVLLAALCIVDHETGEPLFSREEVSQLGKTSPVAMARVVAAAQRLSAVKPLAA